MEQEVRRPCTCRRSCGGLQLAGLSSTVEPGHFGRHADIGAIRAHLALLVQLGHEFATAVTNPFHRDPRIDLVESRLDAPLYGLGRGAVQQHLPFLVRSINDGLPGLGRHRLCRALGLNQSRDSKPTAKCQHHQIAQQDKFDAMERDKHGAA